MDYSHPNNFCKPQFTTAELLKLVGVEYETMRRWLKMGYIRPSMENPGRGRQRFYSLSDIIQIVTIHLLSHLGFLPSWFSATIAQGADSLALLKIIGDYANSQGIKIEYEWTPEDLKEFFKDHPKLLENLKVDSPEWTAGDRYILIFKNSEGEIESKVSALPSLGRGVWITVDVHGILSEAINKIDKIMGKGDN